MIKHIVNMKKRNKPKNPFNIELFQVCDYNDTSFFKALKAYFILLILYL